VLNIAQAEFFHVNVRGTLGGLLNECRERVDDGSPIKTHVRFFDDTGAITRLVEKARKIKVKRRAADRAFSKAQGWYRKWLDYKISRLAGRSLAIGEEALALAAKQLQLAADLKRPIAFETTRRTPTYRPVRADEVHELVEAAKKASGVWLWLYAPAPKLDDRSPLIGTSAI